MDKEEDEEYGVEGARPSISSVGASSDTAVDITAQFVYERLRPRVVTNLVLISLVSFSFLIDH